MSCWRKLTESNIEGQQTPMAHGRAISTTFFSAAQDSGASKVKFHLEMSADEIAATRWFLEHLSFGHYADRVPPHLGRETVTNRAYEIRDALNTLQRQLPERSASSWMYQTERAVRK
jgi:hypothetical protein